jgi:hypothetical protein
VLRSPGLAVLRRSRGDVLAGLELDERDEQPRAGESPQSGPFSFTTIRIRRQDRGETRIRCPIVAGELLAAGVQPSHGSDPTPCRARARSARMATSPTSTSVSSGPIAPIQTYNGLRARIWPDADFLGQRGLHFRN